MKMKDFLPSVYAGAAAGLMVVVFYSCNKTDLLNGTSAGNPKSGRLATQSELLRPSTNIFKATVGAPVDAMEGNKWIDNFKRSNGGSGKAYLLQRADLEPLLNNTACVGICLYFGLDEAKNAYLLPMGVNADGMLMRTSYVASQAGAVSWETAKRWIANDTDPIDARFFGRNTFSRLFNDKNCQTIRATVALDDNQKPQLLLGNAAVNYQAVTTWGSFRFEDASAVCPPVCPIEGN